MSDPLDAARPHREHLRHEAERYRATTAAVRRPPVWQVSLGAGLIRLGRRLAGEPEPAGGG